MQLLNSVSASREYCLLVLLLSIRRRFWSKIKISENGCWLWDAGTFKSGYGAFSVYRQTIRAHRVMFEMEIEELSDEENVLHSCDNPPCVNPMHLFRGTYQDNRDDCVAKARHSFGARHYAAKLTEEDVRKIRLAGAGQRSLAKRFGVTRNAVRQILKGLAWRHVV